MDCGRAVINALILLALAGFMHATKTFGAGSPASVTVLAFGYLMLASFFGGKLVSRLRMPKLTGYLLVGVVSGPFVLDLVTASTAASLKFVSDTAICVIALTAGCELNWRRIRPIRRTLWAITAYAVIGAMAALGGVLLLIRSLLPFLDGMDQITVLAVCATIGVALSAQSPAVVMALLSETAAEGPLSQTILGSVVIADLVVIIMYSIVATIASATLGGRADVIGVASAVTWELFGSIVFGGLLGAILGVYLKRFTGGAVVFALLLCVIVAELGPLVHFDPLITMIAAGLWLENVANNAAPLLRDVETGRLPLFLVFFAIAGTHIDIGQLAELIVPVGILVVARAAAFFIGGRIATASTNADPVVRKYAWFGLVPQAGLALALALLVQRTFPSFGNAAAAVIFGVIGTNELIAPVILRLFLVRSGEAGKRQTLDIG
jgi:Kef-type K+ transport system membrane component KefB